MWARGFGAEELCACGEPFSVCPHWSRVEARVAALVDELDPSAVADSLRSHLRIRYMAELLVPRLVRKRFGAHDRLRCILAALYEAVADVTGAEVVVDSSKSPLYGLFVSSIPNVELHVVHLVRDSRAVAYSLTRSRRLPEIRDREALQFRLAPTKGAMSWMLNNALAGVLATRARTHLRVRYEDFVRDPGPAITAIQRNLGTTARTSDVLADGVVHLGTAHTIGGNPVRFSARGPVPLRLDVEWRARLASRDRRRVTALTWPLLLRYGYRMSGPA